MFAAAQAAQKTTVPDAAMRFMFAAAQAAQKRSSGNRGET